MDDTALRKTIESTLLSATASEADVLKLCRDAVRFGFQGVCVAPARAAAAVRELRGTAVRVVSVAGFPLGNQTTRVKSFEAAELVGLGVDEVDALMNVGAFLEGRIHAVLSEFVELRRIVGGEVGTGLVFKVILETGCLTPEQIDEAARMAVDAGADFLKTSTGYGPRGASVEDVRQLRAIAGRKRGVKASGGIRTLRQALDLIEAGADRIGTSSAVRIVEEAAGTPPKP